MIYTIKISDSQTELAQSLLLYLEALAQSPEYSFLEITQIEENLFEKEITNDLEQRYEHFQAEKLNYNDWDNIKSKYLGNEN